MTIAEAKRWIELLIKTMREEISGSYPDPLYKDEVYVALDMAFKALMQMDVLDKIRAEIEQLRNFRAEDYDLEQYCDYFDARIIFRDDVLKIFDKHKAERRVGNDNKTDDTERN